MVGATGMLQLLLVHHTISKNKVGVACCDSNSAFKVFQYFWSTVYFWPNIGRMCSKFGKYTTFFYLSATTLFSADLFAC